MSGNKKGLKYARDVCSETMVFGSLLPLAKAGWRVLVDGRVSASDASDQGGVSCFSSGLISVGKELGSQLTKGDVGAMEGGAVEMLKGGSGASSPVVGSLADTRRSCVLVAVNDNAGSMRLAVFKMGIGVQLISAPRRASTVND